MKPQAWMVRQPGSQGTIPYNGSETLTLGLIQAIDVYVKTLREVPELTPAIRRRLGELLRSDHFQAMSQLANELTQGAARKDEVEYQAHQARYSDEIGTD